MLTLDVLRARYGDCLMLHHGSRRRQRHVLIDGGPSHVFQRYLRPRLEALRAESGGDEPLPLDLVMVSHIDEDHIKGVLDLFKDITTARNDQQQPLVEIGSLWHNSFADIAGSNPGEADAAETRALAVADIAGQEPDLGFRPHTRLVLSSVRQGRQLRDDARRLAVEVNRGAVGDLVVSGDTLALGELTLKVLGPTQAEVDALKTEWDKQVKEILEKERRKRAEAAQYLDSSVFNLASIVVLAEMDGKRLLLTGDARGDRILDGLEAHDLLDDQGKIHIDLLKLPHHGSHHNVEDNFFARVTADHYVVSGDGKYLNPELETFRMLFRARGRDTPYTLHLTYAPDEMDGDADYPSAELNALLDEARADGVPFTLSVPDDDADHLSIPLIDAA
ncbi:MAG: hypothetical protein R3F54_26945 [Alphaproteobacteria bacterium]